MFAGWVNTSFRYICTGSSIFSPCLKATDGDVGAAITSSPSNASSSSRRINVRTCWAFR